MNGAMISYILGQVLRIEGLLMLPSFFVGLIYGERQGWVYLLMGIVTLVCGTLMSLKKPKNTMIYLKEGCVSTALCWIILSAFGAVPFVLTGEIPAYLDALFETVSGFTTTGASILANVELLSHPSLFWRSFTHWIGGMGVLVFILAILPMTGGSQMSLMKAESPGPSVSKLVPRVQSTAKILYVIYFCMTIIQIIFLLIGKMPVFDAITTAFGTAGTGGFGIKNDSMAGYSTYIQVVVTVFMILFGINFSMYFLLLNKKVWQAFKLEEVHWYLGIILVSILVITFNIRDLYSSFGEALNHASFQVGSIITTTGFATTDFNLWHPLSRSILVLLMLIGACAGSTGGGIKVSRIMIAMKSVKKELMLYIHPRSVKKVSMDGKPIEHETVRSTNVFLIAYLLIFAFSVLIISFDGHDLTTNFTAVAATLNNIGPGLEMVGPTGNFGFFSTGAKAVLIFDMLAGRLEIFPLLLLFVPETWKKF